MYLDLRAVNVILFGPPGAGKGTQGQILAARTGLPKVATGDLLRAAVTAGSALGERAESYMNHGLLVPDDVIAELIEEVLGWPEASRGIIMDGFPRTVPQAEAVDRLLAERNCRVDHVLKFEVPEDELVRRLLGRAPEQGRQDDAPKAIQQRLTVYRQETEPLNTYYRDRGVLLEVDGTGSVHEIAERVREAVGT